MQLTASARRWVPAWWRGEKGIGGEALQMAAFPAELLFRGAVAARGGVYAAGVRTAKRAPIPVLSVGNLTVGGTGKTPVAAWLARRLVAAGRTPAIVVRGYGADEVEVHRELNPAVPVFCARRRLDAARDAAAGGADCIVLDDGFQHRALHRDLDIVLVAAERWFEPRRMLPRGPWREPPSALRRAGFVLVSRKVASHAAAVSVAEALERMGVGAPLGIVRLTSGDLAPLEGSDRREPIGRLSGIRVIAVSSLADPEPFLVQLREAGAAVEPMTFPDHHPFSDLDVAEISARLDGASLAVMTRKEAVKLRSRLPPGSALVLEQGVELESGRLDFDDRLARVFGEAV